MRARPSPVPLTAFVVTLLGMYTPRDARANGRFPKAQAIATVPGGDGSTVYLRATFGVLVSHDGGRHFGWLCEQALGFSSTWDPPIAVTRDAPSDAGAGAASAGRLWVALTDGLRVTRDGCDVQDIPSLKGELVADLATDGAGERVYLVTATPGKAAHVWRAKGAKGDVFERLGKGLTGTRFDTLEVAPSDARRLYLTGVPEASGPRAHFFRSDDGGVTLREMKVAWPNDGRLFVSAVDARDPERVLVRQLHDKGSDVLLSTDGGATFRSVLHVDGAMFGFAPAADGVTYYAGSGDPKEGIWRSRDRGEHWEAAAKTAVMCLHADGDRLFACSNPYVPAGYAIAVSRDQGATVSPLATFDAVTGPVACDGGAPSRCAAPWPETRAAIDSRANMADVAPVADASTNDASRVDAPPAAAPAEERPAASRSTCGCRAAGGLDAPAERAPWLAALAAVFALTRRASRSWRAWSRPRDGSRAAQRD